MTYKTDFMIFNWYARFYLETRATRAASLRSFRRWLEKSWSLICSLSASGQRYVVLGRNSLKPFDLISPDLYKISVKGLLSTSVRASFVFSSWVLEVHPSTNVLYPSQMVLFSEVVYPPHVGLKDTDLTSHDFAMYILQARVANWKDIDRHANLQEPARFSSKVRPICLPNQVWFHLAL